METDKPENTEESASKPEDLKKTGKDGAVESGDADIKEGEVKKEPEDTKKVDGEYLTNL